DLEIVEVVSRANQRFGIRHRETELMLEVNAASAAAIVVGGEKAVAPDHAAEVTDPVVRSFNRRLREPARSKQMIVESQVRALPFALSGAGDVLPTPLCQETMIRAGDELGPVLQLHAMGRRDAAPVRQHGRLDVTAIAAFEARSIDLVADPNVL